MIAKILGDKLVEMGLTVATAESCTGGLIGDTITNIPGSSRYFLGGIIAYSNEAKINILGVKRETIERYGAVSEECAKEMAIGVSGLFHADVGISTTGIAGPGGGTEEKPIGLVYIGIYVNGQIFVKRYLFKGNRVEIKRKIAERAIMDAIEILSTK